MPHKDKQLHLFCPFWNNTTLNCEVEEGGLFIPLDNHINIYCTTSKHVHCMQYGIGTMENSKLDKNRRIIEVNRRKHIRVAKDYTVTLVKMRKTGQTASHHSSIAQTIDISMGGMRILVDENFQQDTILQFNFGETAPAPLTEGLARVEWSTPAKKGDLFETGLALFSDSERNLFSSH